MIGHNGYMRDYVNMKKPSAARIAVKRAYRKAKPHATNVAALLALILVTSIDFFN